MRKFKSLFFLGVAMISFISMAGTLKKLDLGVFQITIPVNWKYVKQQGEDSFVGQIKGPKISLSFDFSSSGYAGGLLKTEQEYINGNDWDKGFFYKPGITYTANFNVAKEKAAQMKRLGTTDSAQVKVEADPSYETKKIVLLPTPTEKLKFPKADYIAHLSYRNEKLDVPIELPAAIKAHHVKIDSTENTLSKPFGQKLLEKALPVSTLKVEIHASPLI